MRNLLLWRVVRRFIDERCAQTAAALSFSTLLSLVPTMAVAAAIIARLPFGERLAIALERFLTSNLLPQRAGAIIAQYVAEFAHKTQNLTLIGSIALTLTALVQMFTIEQTFNVIWQVKENRPLLRRIAMHLLALLLGPLVFGTSLAIITFIATASIGLVPLPGWITGNLAQNLAFAFVALLFALLYWGVPNRRVAIWHALFGGILASAGFALMQWLFALYLARFAVYAVIYGAFATIPIFLVWLYLSWGVILAGALLVAELPKKSTPRREARRSR